jgi:hypothetical protein
MITKKNNRNVLFTNFANGVALTTIRRLLHQRIGLSEIASVGVIDALLTLGVPLHFYV